MRNLLLFLALFWVGCTAQSKPAADQARTADLSPQQTAEVNRRIERVVRAEFKVPGFVKISAGERKPSEFPNYDKVEVTFVASEQRQTREFLLSKDGKQLLSMDRMDLTVDPYEKVKKIIDLTGRPPRGNADAKVTVVVYDDYQCPYCARMHETLFQEVMPQYTDRVKIYYKDFPLFQIHPWAARAAIDSNCLAHQNGEAFWRFADGIHAEADKISGSRGQNRPLQAQLSEVDRVAVDAIGKNPADIAALRKCIGQQSTTDLDKSVKEGETLGVNGTPALFINGMKLEGAVPAEELRAALDEALREAGQQPPAAATPAKQAR